MYRKYPDLTVRVDVIHRDFKNGPIFGEIKKKTLQRRFTGYYRLRQGLHRAVWLTTKERESSTKERGVDKHVKDLLR